MAKGGLLHRLSHLVSNRLSRQLAAAAANLAFEIKGFSLGPVYVGGLSLLSVQIAGKNRLDLKLGLHNVAIGLKTPEVSPKVPTLLQGVLGLLAGSRSISLGRTFAVTVQITWPPGGKPRLTLGPLSTDQLRKALKFKYFADAATSLLAPLSKRLHQELTRALTNSKALVTQLDTVYAEIQSRLARMSGLIPTLPPTVNPKQVAACLALSLSHLSTSEKDRTVRVHLSATIRGYTDEGRPCGAAKDLRQIAHGRRTSFRRLSLGAPDLPTSPKGPTLVISHDLINAYLATVWASGGLETVPISLPEVKENGFDIHSLSYKLPPVVTTDRRGRVRLELPELGVNLRTVGEPQRLFAAHLRLGLDIDTRRAGRLRFTVPLGAPPKIFVRCEREAGGPCAAQSRRFQQIADIGTELAFSAELAQPELALEAALPSLSLVGLHIEVTAVQPLPRGVQVTLRVR